MSQLYSLPLKFRLKFLLIHVCEYILRRAQGLVNFLSDLKEGMTNLLSS